MCHQFYALLHSSIFISPVAVVFTALYSDIKSEDSPVKSKKGKGKKDKKKMTVDPVGKKKPKLDELKVLNS